MNVFTEQLESPLVQNLYSTLTTLTAQWSGVNAYVDHWITEIINDEEEISQV